MYRATVQRNEPSGTQLRLLILDVVLAEHRRAGQFATVHVEGVKPAPFALANVPGEPVMLLVKEAGAGVPVAAALPGHTVEISEPIGEGFPVERVAGRELVILCNGSGISAVRPLIEAEIAQGLPRPVHFFYGVLTPDRRSFLADLERWANAGVKVHTVIAQPSGTGWTGPTGLVQDAAREQGLVRDDVGVVLVGVPAMLAAARAIWRDAGCPDEHILVNF